MAVKVIERLLTRSSCYNSGKKITPNSMQLHTIGTAQDEAEALAQYWDQPNIQACVHYCVDAKTPDTVLHFLPDNYKSWADAGYGNNNSITVELMESDCMRYTSGANFAVSDSAQFKKNILTAYNTAVEFFAMKCKEYGWDPTERMANGLHRVYSHDEGRQLGLSSGHVDPTHVWGKFGLTMDQFRKDVKKVMEGEDYSPAEPVIEKLYRIRKTWKNEASQVGAYSSLDNAKKACPSGYKIFDENGKQVYSNPSKIVGTQFTDFKGLTEKEAAEKLLSLVHDTDKSGILYSVTTAQAILESGYVTTQLSTANNIFGMKTTLSGNQWANSAWDGTSFVTIRTAEEYTEGSITHIDADFRKYACLEDSIKDHSAYLLGAMNGEKKRYEGLTDCVKYRDAITLIKNGGYATDSKYVDKICNIIERYDLARYDKELWKDEIDVDVKPIEPTKEDLPDFTINQYYRVGQAWKNGVCVGQVGAYISLDNAKKKADQFNMKVFDDNGKEVYSRATQYRVQCGSFSDKNNAVRMVARVKDAGFDCMLVSNGTHIAQAGLFSEKANAEKLAKNIAEKGLPVAIITM